MRSKGSLKLIVALLIGLAGAATYFSQSSYNEITGEKQRVSLEPEQEIALGLEASRGVSAQFGGELEHPIIDRYVEGVGGRVVANSDAGRSPYRYDFHVLKDPETVNAFALPGGQVFITVGLLRRLTNEAQLAGVLGHEIGHVVARHGAEHLAKQQLTQSLVGAVGVAGYDPNDPAASQRNAAIAAAVGQLVNMKYGRSDELESDELGVKLMKAAGYDPVGAIELMKVLKEAGGGKRTPEFFSTHPDPENRIERLEALAQKYGPGGERGEAAFETNVLVPLRGLANTAPSSPSR